ncbi:MAG TPA: RHS repeat-associated core domain-containing protein, partial [Blastocatellia bacterium]|nr:RHS repeat-associated core domain-containing protein [Blastocatellia bacterium]
NSTQQYVYGVWIDEPLTLDKDVNDDGAIDQTLFYHQDAKTYVAALTDTTSGVTDRVTYDAYGTPSLMQASADNPYLFTARRFDPEAGVYWFRNRYHAPRMGRFVQRDLVRLWWDSSLGWGSNLGNAYAYALNSPLDATDPLGRFTILWQQPSTGFPWEWLLEIISFSYPCGMDFNTFGQAKENPFAPLLNPDEEGVINEWHRNQQLRDRLWKRAWENALKKAYEWCEFISKYEGRKCPYPEWVKTLAAEASTYPEYKEVEEPYTHVVKEKGEMIGIVYTGYRKVKKFSHWAIRVVRIEKWRCVCVERHKKPNDP